MTVRILHPGMLTTIQDLGRYGFQKFGVIASGAMDRYSLRIANLLVGNKEDEGTLEVTLLGPTIIFEKDLLIAITGGDLQASIDGQKAMAWRPILVRKGSILKFKTSLKGCRAYIAIAGGFKVPEVMGSKSTYLRAGIGGFSGRALQKDDQIQLNEMNGFSQKILVKLNKLGNSINWSVNYSHLINLEQTQTVRVMRGTEFDCFDQASQSVLFHKPFTLTTEMDRMGYRLEGPTLRLSNEFELLSEGVTHGTIQVPPNGKPIILMADRQTTGGYPKIGQVISADLPSLAQLRPKAMIHLKEVSLEEAEKTLLKQERIINEIKTSIRLKWGF